MRKGLASTAIVVSVMCALAYSACAHADPSADFKIVTLSAYVAECTADSIKLCQFDLGKYVRERWINRHGADAPETCTDRAGDQMLSDTDLGTSIWNWLNAHPELDNTNTYQAFVRALDAEYPCVDETPGMAAETSAPSAGGATRTSPP